ncbi:GNAT family N-acetyltransferase [Salinibius halmophilus]|uniref:GNAT family N-acetyltransferase n=1 Tax=Salinibius halmophilus TaxID=1853216 RepID=UPI000E673FEF|nr:GNAT family N-acetyltransferase [Salinibius halmophilus]
MTEIILHSGAATELDTYVRQHNNASAYHLSAWRAAVQQAYGHKALCWQAINEQGDTVGVLPASEVRSPLGKHLCSLPFCDLGGPLADSPEIATQLAKAAAKYGKKLDLRCDAGHVNSVSEGTKVRMIGELMDSSEALIASYKPKLRSQIRKSEKNGLTASIQVNSGAAIADFFDVYAQNMLRLGSIPHAKQWFQAVQQHYGDDSFVALVFMDNKVVGAGLVLRVGNNAVIPWASTLADYNKLAPNMLLYWAIQAYLCDSGATQFDFGRSSYGEGTFRFKKQWGAQPHVLDWQTWTASGQQPKAETGPGLGAKVRPIIEKTWQKLPLSVSNSLGGTLRRYITL